MTSPHHSAGSGSIASNGTSNTASWPRTPTAWYPSAGATTPMSFGLQPLSPSDGGTGMSGGTCTVLGEDLGSKKGSISNWCTYFSKSSVINTIEEWLKRTSEIFLSKLVHFWIFLGLKVLSFILYFNSFVFPIQINLLHLKRRHTSCAWYTDITTMACSSFLCKQKEIFLWKEIFYGAAPRKIFRNAPSKW